MVLEIIPNFEFPKQFWAVGSSFGGKNDQTSKFISNDQWIEGWGLSNDERYKSILETVQVGDVLAMKSSGTKGLNHLMTFTKLKAIGIVLGKVNYYTFSVKWYNSKSFPLDFDGIRYSKTIEQLRSDDIFKYVTSFITKLKLQP
jgi:hypothetical protein